MIKIEKVSIHGTEEAIRGMRNPKNSWERSDSGTDGTGFQVGQNDHDLMMRLAAGGPVHAKYRRMIAVYADITAPLYWWKEFDTYKVGTVSNSTSSMHKITANEFTMFDFSFGMTSGEEELINAIIERLEANRKIFNATHDKQAWWNIIQILPSSYNQKRTIMMNYEVLVGIYRWRKDHKLDEWREFCEWIERLPHSEIITGEKDEVQE